MAKPLRHLERASSLLETLSVCETPDDFAVALVTRVFAREGLRWALVFDIDGSTELRRIGAFAPPEVMRLPERISIWDDMVVTRAFREERFVRENTLGRLFAFGREAPFEFETNGIIAFPLSASGKNIGAVSLLFSKPLDQYEIDDEELRFVQLAVGHLIHDWRWRNKQSAVANEHRQNPRLTRRQHLILSALTEDKTLREIAVESNVSEGTVKLEVQRIYRFLGVHTRRDALQVAEKLMLVN